MVNVTHGGGGGLQCLTGQVSLFPQTGIGATNGVLLVHGHAIRIRQVPGPNNGGIPLSDADGRTVSACGNFLVDGGQVIFSLQVVRPLLQSRAKRRRTAGASLILRDPAKGDQHPRRIDRQRIGREPGRQP